MRVLLIKEMDAPCKNKWRVIFVIEPRLAAFSFIKMFLKRLILILMKLGFFRFLENPEIFF